MLCLEPTLLYVTVWLLLPPDGVRNLLLRDLRILFVREFPNESVRKGAPSFSGSQGTKLIVLSHSHSYKSVPVKFDAFAENNYLFRVFCNDFVRGLCYTDRRKSSETTQRI